MNSLCIFCDSRPQCLLVHVSCRNFYKSEDAKDWSNCMQSRLYKMSSRVDYTLGKQPYRSKVFYVQRDVLCWSRFNSSLSLSHFNTNLCKIINIFILANHDGRHCLVMKKHKNSCYISNHEWSNKVCLNSVNLSLT